jgi:hypothetical protein
MKRLLRVLSLPLRRGVALAMLLAVLATVALAALPSWHAKAHHDARDRNHECAVTLYASGAWHEAPAITLVAPTFVLLPEEAVVEQQRIALSFRFSGILEHAPPVTM